MPLLFLLLKGQWSFCNSAKLLINRSSASATGAVMFLTAHRVHLLCLPPSWPGPHVSPQGHQPPTSDATPCSPQPCPAQPWAHVPAQPWTVPSRMPNAWGWDCPGAPGCPDPVRGSGMVPGCLVCPDRPMGSPHCTLTPATWEILAQDKNERRSSALPEPKHPDPDPLHKIF